MNGGGTIFSMKRVMEGNRCLLTIKKLTGELDYVKSSEERLQIFYEKSASPINVFYCAGCDISILYS